MKRLTIILLAIATLLVVAGSLPIAAYNETAAEVEVDGRTCATPPVEPAKRDTTKTKKQKNKQKKQKKDKKQKGEAKDTATTVAKLVF